MERNLVHRALQEWERDKLHCIWLILVWVSPFYQFVRWKVNRLYDGYLKNRRVAENFRNHYLPMEFWHKEGLVLDFGCGRGRHCAMLSQCGFKIIGIDLETFDYWLKIPNSQFIQGNEGKLEAFHDETFDLAISFQVLYAIKDDVILLNELFRVVKQGGYLVLQVPNQDNLRTVITHKYLVTDPQIMRYYTIEGITLLLSNVGFKVVNIWTEKFYPPYLLSIIGFLLEFILPHCVQEWASNHTPSRNRGLINVIAQKVLV